MRDSIHRVHPLQITLNALTLTLGLLIAQLALGSLPVLGSAHPSPRSAVAQSVPVAARPSARPSATRDLSGWQLGPDVYVPRFNNMDITPAIIHDGTTLWVLYSDGTTWHRFRGTSMDYLVEMSPAKYNTPAHPFPNGIAHCADDHYWIGGAWSDGHVWYATIHIEFGYFDLSPHGLQRCLWEPPQFGSPHYFRRIGLATSTDHGATWIYAGDIITAPDPPQISASTGAYFDFGDGDQRLFVDTQGGYFYLYYQTAWCATSDQQPFTRYPAIRVARSPMSAKMAPGSWTKWYNQAWSQPGLGGRDSDVFYGADSVVVTYSTYLHAYLAIGHYPGFLATTTDLSLQAWSAPRSLSDLTRPSRLEWYNWPMDPTTWDSMTMTGSTFRLYSADSYSGSAAMCPTCAPTKYLLITLNAGPPSATDLPSPAYPPISIPNGLPEWQWDVNLAANPGFEQGMLAPWRPSGTGSARVETTAAHQGTAALEITGPRMCVTQSVTNLVPDRPYVLSAWLAADPGNRATLSVGGDPHPDDGSSPGLTFAAIPSSMATTPFLLPEAHGPFKQVSIPFTVAPRRTGITIAICSTTSVGSIYADDVLVTVGRANTGGAQMNPSRAEPLLVHN